MHVHEDRPCLVECSHHAGLPCCDPAIWEQAYQCAGHLYVHRHGSHQPYYIVCIVCMPSSTQEWFIPQHFTSSFSLSSASLITSRDGLSSAWHKPSESTLGAKTSSSTDIFLVYSDNDPQISFDKSSTSMKRDSGGMKDMSNPLTVNQRSINSSVYTINQRLMLDRSMRQADHFGSMTMSTAEQKSPYQHNYSSTGHADDFPVTVCTVEVDPPSRHWWIFIQVIEYYVGVFLGACI